MSINETLLYQIIGEKVRAARDRAKMSQVQLAKRLSISRASIVNIEAGRQRAPIHLLWRIAEVLGTEMLSFIPGQDEFDDGSTPIKLNEATIAKIEREANGDPATRRLLTRFIGKATVQAQETYHDNEK